MITTVFSLTKEKKAKAAYVVFGEEAVLIDEARHLVQAIVKPQNVERINWGDLSDHPMMLNNTPDLSAASDTRNHRPCTAAGQRKPRIVGRIFVRRPNYPTLYLLRFIFPCQNCRKNSPLGFAPCQNTPLCYPQTPKHRRYGTLGFSLANKAATRNLCN